MGVSVSILGVRLCCILLGCKVVTHLAHAPLPQSAQVAEKTLASLVKYGVVAMATADVAGKLKELLLSKACQARIDHSQVTSNAGFFWDASVLKSEASMEASLAVHIDFILAVVREGCMLDITPTMIQDAVQALDSKHKGKLFCDTFGSNREWLRAEGSCLKKLLGLIRLKESRSIDCSRQGATMKLLVQAYRTTKQQQQQPGKRRSSGSESSASQKPKLGHKSLWEMSAADIRQAMSGGSETPGRRAVPMEDLSTPQVVKSDDSSEDEGYRQVSAELGTSAPSSTENALDKIIYYHDYANMKMCRTYASGRVEIGKVVDPDTADVFLWFAFPDGQERQSEFPVSAASPVTLPEKKKKKTPGVRKRPASRMQLEKMDQPESQAKEEPEESIPSKVQAHTLAEKLFPEIGEVGSETSRMEHQEQASEEESEEEAEEETPKEVDSVVHVLPRPVQVKQTAPAAPCQVVPAKCPSGPPKSWAWNKDWQPGATAGQPGPDGRIRSWGFSNANMSGQHLLTFAKDQTYLHTKVTAGGKHFMGGLSCGWRHHDDIMCDVVSEVLGLEESFYKDVLTLKDKFKEIRDRLKSGHWIEDDKTSN